MRITALILASLLVAGCSKFSPAPPQEEEEPVSFLTGKPGGLKLSDLGDLNKNDDGGIPVNAILWRASLEIVSLLPIADVDTFGGTIISDWYSLPDNPNERIKLTVFVVDRELRSDAVRVTVHVQTRDGVDGTWSSSVRDEEFARRLEDLILNRAREIRAESLSDIAE
jgi:hypothetical protein